jgi:diaminopimelate decarboxylase
MTGIASQFGFEEDDLLAGADRLTALSPRVRVRGVHVYFGTQVGGCEALAATTRNAIQVAENLSEGLGLTFDLLDVGGGFAWPYASPGAGPDLGGLRTALAELSAGRRRTASARLCFESGRYLCASSGTLVATVMDVKPSKGKQYVVLDTGIHHLGGMSGLGRIPRPIVLLQADGAGDSEPLEEADVVGPLCSPLDCVARNARMPRLKAGDLVRIPNVGAYGLTASLYGFLSRPAPVEVALRRGEVVGAYHLQGGHRRVASEPTRAGASGADGLR